MSKLILFDALQAQAVENADLHIGSGTPCTNNPLVLMGEWDCGAQSACSSMCSAASTVVSALCSMNSTSFPASAETTFDLARNVDKRFLMEDEQRQARKRSRDSSWLLSSIPRSCESSDVRRVRQGKRGRNIRPCNYDIEQWAFDASILTESATSNLEEYCIGSGDPFGRCEPVAPPLIRCSKPDE